MINEEDVIIVGIAKEWISRMKANYKTVEKVTAIHAIIKSLFNIQELNQHKIVLHNGKELPEVLNNPKYKQILKSQIEITDKLIDIKNIKR